MNLASSSAILTRPYYAFRCSDVRFYDRKPGNKAGREDQMGQADAFETDFWKHANLRKVWDDIVPGEPRQTIPYILTKEAIELYCKSVGEDHPIYFDEAYARTTRYGGLIAPPSIHILLMFSCTPADDWMC